MGRFGDVVGAGRSLLTGAVLSRSADTVRLRPLEVPPDLADAIAAAPTQLEAGGLANTTTAAGARAVLAAGELSSLRLTANAVARIVAADPDLNCMIELSPSALADARTADARIARGEEGPLLGVPVTVKDNIETAGPMRTTAGAAILADHVADADAHVVAALRAAGAIIVGKANLSELAGAVCPTPGFSAVGGQTMHPGGAAFTPGGSSSGSAVSVAAGLVPLSVGTETSGSLIAPAAFCGVVGMKPSLGLVPTAGIVPLVRHQDSAGPIATSVADAAALLHVLSGGATPAAPGDDGLMGVRVGVLREAILAQDSPFEDTTDNAAVLRRVDAALQLAGAASADVLVPAGDAADHLDAALLTAVLGGVSHDTIGYLAAHGAPVRTLADLHDWNLADAKRRMPKGQAFLSIALARAIGADQYEQTALRLRADSRRILDAMFDAADAPVLVSISNLHSSLYAAAGYPAITVPMGPRASGMPVGITLIGRANTDAALLAAAAALEAARGSAAAART